MHLYVCVRPHAVVCARGCVHTSMQVHEVALTSQVALLESLGISSFNYKKESVLAGLQRLCPGGIDVSFDNVGGETLEAIIEMTNDTGRIGANLAH